MTDLSRVAARENFALQRAEMMFAKLRTTRSLAPSPDDLTDLRQKVRGRLLGHTALRRA